MRLGRRHRVGTAETAGARVENYPNWQYEPDPAKASEVEIRFTPVDDGSTRVDLEHRNFARMGAGWETMRTMVDGQMGWGELLAIFAAQTEKTF